MSKSSGCRLTLIASLWTYGLGGKNVGRRYKSSNCKDSAALNEKKSIVIVGGGTAGAGLAAMILRDPACQRSAEVTVVEPNEYHLYQPLWTYVGIGRKFAVQSRKPMETVLSDGLSWIQQRVVSFKPDTNALTLDDDSVIHYDYLILATGISCDWKSIPGLLEALQNRDVVSVYDSEYAQNTWSAISDFTGGRAIFTAPTTPVKCPGAAQKIMWLFDERLHDIGLSPISSIELWLPSQHIFGVKKYADRLELLRKERGVKLVCQKELVAVNGPMKTASFKSLEKENSKDPSHYPIPLLTEESFDLLHVTPPMSPPECIKNSSFAASNGFVEVDKCTLRSKRYNNVFAIGDCADLPTSKTAAAITGQAPVIVHNIKQAMAGLELDGCYDGYTSCPLAVGERQTILAEFGYNGAIMETFDHKNGIFPYSLLGSEGQLQERIFAWMSRELFPWVYWNLWLDGRWYGRNGIWKPHVSLGAKKAVVTLTSSADETKSENQAGK